jgi:MFS family permease
MKRPNLLASKKGRLTAFFFLYLTEGIPLGFVAVAVATQLRRQGVGPAEIGAFVGSFYIPWSFKFIAGPVVDVFSSDRWGRRRMWIVLTQSMMVLTLLTTVGVDLPAQLKLFTILLLVHNVFGATQDVAIDALAVGVLREQERGLANGVMFAAAYLGQTVGGSAVLFLMDYLSFQGAVVFVAACIASVTLLIALPLREPRIPRPARGAPLTEAEAGNAAVRTLQSLSVVGGEIGTFARDAARALFGSRPAFVGLLFAVLPAGAMSLGLALQSNLAVEIGLTDRSIAKLNLWSAVLAATGCVVGGQLSDRFGRRRMLALYIVLMAAPVLYLATILRQHGWIMPIDVQAEDRPLAPEVVITAFWGASLVYSVLQGLMYGTRTALFMDVTNPAVAATQFTAYMALLNLVITYSATWQGWWIERFGYPGTLLVDVAFGMLCLALLPFMGKRGAARPAGPSGRSQDDRQLGSATTRHAGPMTMNGAQ